MPEKLKLKVLMPLFRAVRKLRPIIPTPIYVRWLDLWAWLYEKGVP